MRELIPIVGMVFVLGPLAVWAVSMTPLGRALTERLKNKASDATDEVLELQDELDRLSARVDGHDHAVEELLDRLDFAERRLVAGQPAENEVDKVPTPV